MVLFTMNGICLLDSRVQRKVARPAYFLHQLPILRVLEGLVVRVERRRIRLVIISQDGEQQGGLKGELLGFGGGDDLVLDVSVVVGYRFMQRTVVMAGKRSIRRKYAPGLSWDMPHMNVSATWRA